MDKDSLQVSIIVVNYNTLQLTEECIDSVFDKTKGITFEVILIDNRSTDGSKEHFQNDKRIKYIYSFENMGFGRANNIGMMLAKGEYLFLLNSDTILLNNSVKYFYEYAKNHDNDKICNFYGSWLLDKNKQITLSYGIEPTIRTMLQRACLPYLIVLGIIKHQKFEHVENPNYGKTAEVGYVSGADIFVNAKLVSEFGAFDHNFFMYYEEAEWQKRLKPYGVKSYIIEGPQIIHLHSGSDSTKKSKHDSINSMIMMHRSRKYFLRKYYSKFKRFIFFFIYAVLETPVLLFLPYYTINNKIKLIFKR